MRNEVLRIDDRLSKLNIERADVESAMASGRGEDFAELGRRLSHAQAETAMLEERWLELQTELESAQAAVQGNAVSLS